MDIKGVIKSQYHAALEMLKQAVSQCPDSLWNDSADKNVFWRLAYHTLFYTHLYLQVEEQRYTPWPKERGQAQFLGGLPWSPQTKPKIDRPYSKSEILAYLEFCLHEVEEGLEEFELDAESGFYWLPFNKLELQLYNIRHIQSHTGELCERLGARAGVAIEWVGRKPGQPG